VDGALEGLYQCFAVLFPWLVGGVWIAALGAIFVSKRPERGALAFFLYVFLAGLYVTGQIEAPVPRYVLLYLPALALTASLSFALLTSVLRNSPAPHSLPASSRTPA
jgi:hypothetical protein